MIEDHTKSLVTMRKSRQGARGVRKVSTGCLTCKKRHKKCDEVKPACTNCIKTGWKCDFVSSSTSAQQSAVAPPARSLPFPYARPLLDGEHRHMDYFNTICAKEFALFFELPTWSNVILQGTLTEPALHHAALAVGALTKSRYYPNTWSSPQARVFSIRQYSMAIQSLQHRLDGSSQSLELAILTSIVFSWVEFLLGLDSRLEIHIQAGCAMLENLYSKHDSTSTVPSQAKSDCQAVILPPRYQILASAMVQLTEQVDRFVEYGRIATIDQ